jgi:hypothetical protein
MAMRHVAGCDLSTRESAFGLDHRALPEGADIKLIWELSRWYQLVRLARRPTCWTTGAPRRSACAGWRTG